MFRMIKTVLKLACGIIVVYGLYSMGMRFEFIREAIAKWFSTQSKIACELLANEQIAELAVRKMKWKVVTSRESMHESLLVSTVYTLKFGFDLAELNKSKIVVDDENGIVTIPLPPVKLLSVDHFGDRKIVHGKKTLARRIFSDAYDSGASDVDEERELINDLETNRLVDAVELASDFENALQPFWEKVGTFKLKVLPPDKNVDVSEIFELYHKNK